MYWGEKKKQNKTKHKQTPKKPQSPPKQTNQTPQKTQSTLALQPLASYPQPTIPNKLELSLQFPLCSQEKIITKGIKNLYRIALEK